MKEQEKINSVNEPQNLAAWRHAKARLQISLKYVKGTIGINCEECAANVPAFDLTRKK